MTNDVYDIFIIGAGPGGYVAAIRAAQLGLKVAVVDKRDRAGGVCLNEGCIPSKALLDSTELFVTARDGFSQHGIEIEPPRLNLERMMARKEEVVRKLTDGISFLFKKNRVDFIRGTARLMSRNENSGHELEVVSSDGTSRYRSKRVLIASGSEAAPIPAFPFDGEIVVSAREALSFNKVPEHLVVVGAGYIGLELGSVWRRLGSRITVVEMLPKMLPKSDGRLAESLMRSLKKQGIQFRMAATVKTLERNGGKAVLTFVANNNEESIECDRILVAAGRRPLTSGLGLEEVGIVTDASGRIIVTGNYETSVPGIHAIGDVIAGPMLAHRAMEEGSVFAERLAGQASRVDYEFLPGIIYTWPEAASVGKTEEELKEESIPYRAGSFPFMANGRAKCMGETEGFVKILAHQETGKVLGVHILGPRASDMIAEAVTVMTFGGSALDIALTLHAHPSLSEAMKEAALDVEKRAIHA